MSYFVLLTYRSGLWIEAWVAVHQDDPLFWLRQPEDKVHRGLMDSDGKSMTWKKISKGLVCMVTSTQSSYSFNGIIFLFSMNPEVQKLYIRASFATTALIISH